jgi:hypothetical protein
VFRGSSGRTTKHTNHTKELQEDELPVGGCLTFIHLPVRQRGLDGDSRFFSFPVMLIVSAKFGVNCGSIRFIVSGRGLN